MSGLSPTQSVNALAVLASLPHAVLAVGPDGEILFANPAAESFFGIGGQALKDKPLESLVGAGSQLMALIARARRRGAPVADSAIQIAGPIIGPRSADASAAPLTPDPDIIVVSLRERMVMERAGEADHRREALRPVMSMAALLAHEIKNPLSGIKGAAQLLERRVDAESGDLTRLISEEVDRIAELVDRMDVFRDHGEIDPEPVNIHEALAHVRRVAEAGFGSGVVFEEQYDPSLPEVLGARPLLIQVLMNLIKNACEACGADGRVTLATAFRHDLRMRDPGGRSTLHLPLEVRIEDNGPGVASNILETLFEPFVSARSEGEGLGLALVAKAVADHGGIIRCESRPGHTVFTLRLPMATEAAKDSVAEGALP